MTNEKHFEIQKEVIINEFNAVFDEKMAEVIDDVYDSLGNPDMNSFLQAIMENGDFEKAGRKAKLKFADLINKYSIVNGKDEIYPIEHVTFVAPGFGDRDPVSVEELQRVDIVTAFGFMNDGKEIASGLISMPYAEKFKWPDMTPTVTYSFEKLITKQNLIGFGWCGDHIKEGNGEWLVQVL